MKHLGFVALVVFSLGGFAEAAVAAKAHDVSGILSLVKRADGQYDVTCSDGTKSTVTYQDIENNRVCTGNVPLPAPDVTAVYARQDGSFNVLCGNNTWEVDSAAQLQQGAVCGAANTTGPVCGTKDNYVHYQIPGPSTASVTCYYSLNGTKSPFSGSATYSPTTQRWTCPDWTPGNPQYQIFIQVDGASYQTSEDEALAHPCP